MYISKEETKEIRNAFKKEFDSLTWLVLLSLLMTLVIFPILVTI